jgi:hypothetical protein
MHVFLTAYKSHGDDEPMTGGTVQRRTLGAEIGI